VRKGSRAPDFFSENYIRGADSARELIEMVASEMPAWTHALAWRSVPEICAAGWPMLRRTSGMQIVSVINYKGGVGKTTLTANLASELAWRGHRVLMIDLDAQASLTFAFVRPDYWQSQLEPASTIKAWYDARQSGNSFDLSSLAFEPSDVQRALRGKAPLHLIPSHLGLINVDLELATGLAGASLNQAKINYMRVHRQLAEELAKPEFQEYDLILIDCPPNFNIVTKTAIVASDYVLIPAKPDYLSTLGIDYLARSLGQLVKDYNDYAGLDGAGHSDPINPQVLGVVFTMVQIYGQQPVSAQRPYIAQVKALKVPVFDSYVRENKTLHAGAAAEGIPIVLEPTNYRGLRSEMEAVVGEFIKKLGL
jgi:chromosome partitioning protein